METTLRAIPRDGTGKSVTRKLRAEGLVPAVLYGHGMAPRSLTVTGQDLLHLFHASSGGSVLVDLDVEGEKHLVILREIQRDHLHGKYIHIDFLEVRRDEKVRMTVEIREKGDAPGVKEGGVIEHHLRELEVECFPGDTPEVIEADVSTLSIGDMLRVGDIPEPRGVAFLTEADTPVISVIIPAIMRTEADLSVPGEAPVEGAPEPEPEDEAAEAAEGAPAPETDAAPAAEPEG